MFVPSAVATADPPPPPVIQLLQTLNSTSKQTAATTAEQQPSSPPSQVQCSLCGWNFDNDNFLQLHTLLMHSKRLGSRGTRYYLRNEMAYYFMAFYQIGWFSSICHLHGWVIFTLQKIAFSVDTQPVKNRNSNFFLITKPCRYQCEAAFFNQERLLYCI